MAPGAETRSRALDGLRGLAVMQVVIFHYYLLKPVSADWYQMLRRVGGAVDGLSLFFVLSGFLIGGHLVDARGSPGMFRVFYWRRACRILPLYLVLLASYGAIRLVDQHWKLGFIYYWYSEFPFWNYLVFWQNQRMEGDMVLGAAWLAVTWSLAVEMQFYAIAPWVVRYVSNRWLTGLGLVCVLAGPFVRHDLFNYLLIDRLDALMAGVLLALLLRNAAAQAALARSRGWLRWLVALYLVAQVVLRVMGASSPVLTSQTTAAVVFAVWIALLTDGAPWPVMRPAVELLAPFGLLSYFIYLFHMPVSYVFLVLAPGTGGVAALPVTIVLAILSYRLLERPLIRWGHRLT